MYVCMYVCMYVSHYVMVKSHYLRAGLVIAGEAGLMVGVV